MGEEILDEVFDNLRKNRPEPSATSLLRTRQLACDAVPDCLIANFSGLADHLNLPDVSDRHVVAAAVRCSAQTIVTFNLKDFPESVLSPFGIEAIHPDDVVLDTLHLAPLAVASIVSQQAAALRSPAVSLPQLLDTLRACGLEQSVTKIHAMLGTSL